MSYASSKGLPVERASKIAHMQVIQERSIQELLQSFHSDDKPKTKLAATKTGHVGLDEECCIKTVITVDGGLAIVPNPRRRDKTVAFCQVGTCMLFMKDLLKIQRNPMLDPREIKEMFSRVTYRPAVLPLAGVRIPGMTIRDTIRHTLNGILTSPYTDLYWVLDWLVHRKWHVSWPSGVERPSMNCYSCGHDFQVPPQRCTFSCPSCGHEHFFSDYLQIGKESPDEWSREDVATALMSVLEVLSLFEIPAYVFQKGCTDKLKNALFVKDGPLLLRAALSRLVEPIRDFLSYARDRGVVLNIVGIEKNGDFVNYLDEFSDVIPTPGDFFLPSVKFMVEEVAGLAFEPDKYRNRVSFGAKLAVRLSPTHVLPLSIPTGSFLETPKPSDLIGLDSAVRALAKLTSSRYDNALIPLVLANRAVSLSRSPGGNILHDFVSQMVS